MNQRTSKLVKGFRQAQENMHEYYTQSGIGPVSHPFGHNCHISLITYVDDD